jgi:hypothetical protein
LPTKSGDWIDSPVTLPPGRPRLATKPLADRVHRYREDNRNDWRCLLCGCDAGSGSDNDVDLEAHELGGDLGDPFGAPLRPAILDSEIVPLGPAKLA